MNAGRLVIPALSWRAESGFAHEAPAIAAALGFGAGGFVIRGGTADAVFELTSHLRADAGRPLLIAAELERGPGQQVTGLDELPPPRALASLNDAAVLRGAGVLTALEALSVGINWILAPVLDLDLEPENDSVQTRAFGEDPDEVSLAGTAWIVGCEAGGALACGKHFPGLEQSPADARAALKPFAAASAAGVSSMLLANAAYPAFDPTGMPAPFSEPITRLLREELGFGGLIASDAVQSVAAERAIRAGVDLLLAPSDPSGVTAALAGNSALGVRVEAALERYQSALESAPVEEPPERLPAAGSSVAAADWVLSAPLLRGEPPILTAPLELIVIDELQEQGTPSAVEQVLSERGIALSPGGSRVVLAVSAPSGFGARSRARLEREAAGAALVILFGHPRLLSQIPGNAPVLLAWHPQRLMQEAAARWVAERIR